MPVSTSILALHFQLFQGQEVQDPLSIEDTECSLFSLIYSLKFGCAGRYCGRSMCKLQRMGNEEEGTGSCLNVQPHWNSHLSHSLFCYFRGDNFIRKVNYGFINSACKFPSSFFSILLNHSFDAALLECSSCSPVSTSSCGLKEKKFSRMGMAWKVSSIQRSLY